MNQQATDRGSRTRGIGRRRQTAAVHVDAMTAANPRPISNPRAQGPARTMLSERRFSSRTAGLPPASSEHGALAGSSARCREGNRLYLDKLIRIAENRDA
jgi:hypothetical protein